MAAAADCSVGHLYESGVDVDRLGALLADCPAVPADLRHIVLQRFITGAEIGSRGLHTGRLTDNNRSAMLRPAGVTAAIEAEVATGTTRGPFASPPLPNFVVNPLSARDKPDGSIRLILDLSQPAGESINDGIDADQYRLSYTSTTDAFLLIHRAGGTGALLAKVGIKSAFKLIPVRPDQWRLLGFWWGVSFISRSP